jgi:hypothetical protein
MKHFFTLIITLLSLLSLNAQTTLYIEDFDDDTYDLKGHFNTTTDMAGVSNWSIDISNGTFTANDDYFLQNNDRFRVKDADAPNENNACWWYSTVVAISGYTNVTVSCDLIPNASSSSNYERFYYSLDGGAWTPIGAAVDGNDASVTRTLAGLSGTTMQVRVGYWATSGQSAGQLTHDNVLIVGTPPACTAPALVPASPVFSSITTTSMNVAWTNGGGTETLVVVKESGVTLVEPVSTNAYTANTAYSVGQDLGGGNYVVYNTAGSSVTVTGLSPGTTYDYAIYTFNSADNCYNLDEIAASENTICTPPATQASSLSFPVVAKNSMDISWVNGSGTAVLVVAKLTSSTHADPAIGVTYTANNSFGSGDQIGTGNYVIYNGVGTTVSMVGLIADTDYDLSIYSYFSASDCYNLTELAGTQKTLAGTNYNIANGTYEIDAYNGDTITTCGGFFTDSNPSTTGNYGDNEDYTITFCSASGVPLSFDFDDNVNAHYDPLVAGDTLYMYDENMNLIMQIDGTDEPTSGTTQFNLSSTSQCVTFRFISNGSGNDDGWKAIVACIAPPANCNGNEPAADIALQAPYICNFDGYCGSTSSYYNEDLPDEMVGSGGSCLSSQAFLGTIENNSWIRFLAGATSISMDFTVSGCGTNGIQVAILGDDGSGWTRYSGCAETDGANTGTFTLTATGLTIGEEYYMMADGNAGANCNYTINVDASSGIITVDAGTDQQVCSGDPVNLSVAGPPGATYTWNSLDGVVTNASGANQTFNPIVATTYVVEVSGGGVCQTQTDTVEVTMCSVLPLDLLGFSVECKTDFVELNWQTASELNNDYFVVEKSVDATSFTSIGSVSGSGNSNSVNTYSFQDFENNNGLVYYRFKQVDFNGDYSYSNIVAANNCNEDDFDINNVFFNSSTN